MASKIDLRMLEDWCQDARTILGATGVPENIIRMQRATIARNSGQTSLFGIAEDCAVGLGDLPCGARQKARIWLLEKHGLDFNFFLEKKLAKIKAVLKRGKIRNETEFRDMSEFVTDTSQPEAILGAVESLLADYNPLAKKSESKKA